MILIFILLFIYLALKLAQGYSVYKVFWKIERDLITLENHKNLKRLSLYDNQRLQDITRWLKTTKYCNGGFINFLMNQSNVYEMGMPDVPEYDFLSLEKIPYWKRKAIKREYIEQRKQDDYEIALKNKKYLSNLLARANCEDEADKEWSEIWRDIYAFQNTIPHGIEPVPDNAKKLGLMITFGEHREPLFIDKDLSHRLFLYRVSH